MATINQTHDTQALILSTKDYGESDRLITFYTESAGKLRGIAKGARRSQKRFVHAFEPLSLVALTYKERKSSLAWIEACKLIEPHLALRVEVDRWAYAALASEVMQEMAPEGEPQPELFALFRETLVQLGSEKEPLNTVLLFLLRFLDLLGYLPALERCSVCGRPIREANRWAWRVSAGALSCMEHGPFQEDQLVLDLGTLLLIGQVRRLELMKLWRLHVAQDRQLPLLRSLLAWVRGQIHKELKSLRLLEQLQSA